MAACSARARRMPLSRMPLAEHGVLPGPLQGNSREAFLGELRRRTDRVRRWLCPRPPAKLIPIDAGDLCAFCHEELLRAPPGDQDDQRAVSEAIARIADAQLRAHLEEKLAAALDSCAADTSVVGRLLCWHTTLRTVGWLAQALLGERGRLARLTTLACLRSRIVLCRAAEEGGRWWRCWRRPILAAATAASGSPPSAASAFTNSSDDALADATAADAANASDGVDGAAIAADATAGAASSRHVLHCRWGCGKAVHRACAEAWGRNACVYCAAPMY